MTHQSSGISSSSTALAVYQPPVPRMNPRDLRNFILQTSQNMAMAQSFMGQMADHKHFCRQGSVIILVGSSSAGKSTILNAIKERKPGCVDLGVDLFGNYAIYESMQKNHERFGVSDADWEHFHSVLIPKSNQEHIHDAVGSGEFAFKTGVSVEDQERAMKTAAALLRLVESNPEDVPGDCISLENAVLDRSLATALKGYDVITDFVFTERLSQHILSKQPFVRSVFVYCPLSVLVDHIADRNTKALSGQVPLGEIRAGSFPLLQYAGLVRPRHSDDTDNDVIDRVTRQSVEDDFDRNFDACTEVRRMRDPSEIDTMESNGQLEADRVREKATLLEDLGFKSSDSQDRSIEFVPRDKLNLSVNTGDSSLGKDASERGQTAAERILKTF